MIVLNRFPEGKKAALTLSYDDGRFADRRLVEIMDKYGIRGTFHLNSGGLGNGAKVLPEEINGLYKNHEISCHGVGHRSLTLIPKQNVIAEIFEDRLALEKITGKIVRGMSYANGAYSDETIAALESCGIVYARTVDSTGSFNIPENFMKWHPTCHHLNCIEKAERFLTLLEKGSAARLFYVWGHSYEFDQSENWELIEEFCRKMSGHEDIWYATNIEIYEYVTALRRLVISADNKLVYNPSALTVWFSCNSDIYKVKSGETIKID